MTRNLKQWEYIFDSDDDDVDNLNQMKKKKQKTAHLRSGTTSRSRWRRGRAEEAVLSTWLAAPSSSAVQMEGAAGTRGWDAAAAVAAAVAVAAAAFFWPSLLAR